ncbi:MAG TPA: hypothetical protein VGL56_13910 [Fimbriimonadaceae bacterium]
MADLIGSAFWIANHPHKFMGSTENTSVPNKVALVCPVHMPKFAQFREFVASYELVQPDCDLYFILSEEARHKEAKYKEVWDRTEFIYTPTVTPNDSVISCKKFHGLHQLWKTQRYEGIAAVDVDSVFAGVGFHESFARFKHDPTIFGCPLSRYPTKPFHDVVRLSTRLFGQSEELDRYKKIYAWWNTIPWYQSEHISAFLTRVGFYQHGFVNQDWHSFDQVMYHGWLISEGLAKVGDMHISAEMPEKMRPDEIANLASRRLDWIGYAARESSVFAGQNPLMYFHTDRLDEASFAA